MTVVALIGPPCAGKTSVGWELADMTGSVFVDIDDIGDTYYREVGWDVGRLRARSLDIGRLAAECEWEPARAHAVERLIADAHLIERGAGRDVVIALGAGHTAYTRAAPRDAVARALSSVDQVVYLTPSLDPGRALEVLCPRVHADRPAWGAGHHALVTNWVSDPAVRALATVAVETGEDEPRAVATRISARPSN